MPTVADILIDGLCRAGVQRIFGVPGGGSNLELLEAARAALPDDFPLLLAGGIASRADVCVALEAGACAAVAGTRFLLADESRAHPGYRERLLAASETLLTELFGLGWPAPHRVVANAATERHLGRDPRGPLARRALNRLSGGVSVRVPPALQARLARAQRPASLLLSPTPPTDDGPASLVDAGPLYAGETVARIRDLRPAAELVGALTP